MSCWPGESSGLHTSPRQGVTVCKATDWSQGCDFGRAALHGDRDPCAGQGPSPRRNDPGRPDGGPRRNHRGSARRGYSYQCDRHAVCCAARETNRDWLVRLCSTPLAAGTHCTAPAAAMLQTMQATQGPQMVGSGEVVSEERKRSLASATCAATTVETGVSPPLLRPAGTSSIAVCACAQPLSPAGGSHSWHRGSDHHRQRCYRHHRGPPHWSLSPFRGEPNVVNSVTV